jgi:hypothetical protein
LGVGGVWYSNIGKKRTSVLCRYIEKGLFLVGKRWLIVGFVGMLLLTIVNVAYGVQAITLVIKGEKVQSETLPIIKNGRTYVPL